jgi:Holliday junction DNA helicase RuvA
MIGYLNGKILSKNFETSACTLLCGQVGYEILVPSPKLETFEIGTEIGFWIHTHVREDTLTLYGFQIETEKFFFRLLLSVSGLGPKTALSLISHHGSETLTRLLIQKDSDGLSQAPGVGKKLAQKLVIELSSKIEKISWIEELKTKEKLQSVRLQEPQHTQLKVDLVSALMNLGFAPAVIKPVVDNMESRSAFEKENFEDCLRLALSELSGRKGAEIRHGNA